MARDVPWKIDDTFGDVPRQDIPKPQPPRLPVILVHLGRIDGRCGPIEECAPPLQIVQRSCLQRAGVQIAIGAFDWEIFQCPESAES